jgi:hypothetical protein
MEAVHLVNCISTLHSHKMKMTITCKNQRNRHRESVLVDLVSNQSSYWCEGAVTATS